MGREAFSELFLFNMCNLIKEKIRLSFTCFKVVNKQDERALRENKSTNHPYAELVGTM